MSQKGFFKLAAVLAVVAGAGAGAVNARADLAVQLAGGYGSGASGGAHPCESAVAARLQQHGLNMSDMSDVRWYADRFAREGGNTGGVSTYRFYGRPPSCESGSIAVTMSPSCGIQNVRTRGSCEVAGVSC